MSATSILARLRPGLLSASGTESSLCPAGNHILVVGVCLADKPNNAESIITNLAESRSYAVTQCWATLGARPNTPRLLESVRLHSYQPIPKFTLINRLLQTVDLSCYRYLIICDDDIELSPYFLDGFLAVQRSLDFRLAQPARTSDSYIDHGIVEQCPGLIARQTLFVECGPLVSVHESVYELLIPFHAESPMGWGYENIWSYRLGTRGHHMGIIDALPIAHRMRAPATYYSSIDRRQDMGAFCARIRTGKCTTVIRRFRKYLVLCLASLDVLHAAEGRAPAVMRFGRGCFLRIPLEIAARAAR